MSKSCSLIFVLNVLYPKPNYIAILSCWDHTYVLKLYCGIKFLTTIGYCCIAIVEWIGRQDGVLRIPRTHPYPAGYCFIVPNHMYIFIESSIVFLNWFWPNQRVGTMITKPQWPLHRLPNQTAVFNNEMQLTRSN